MDSFHKFPIRRTSVRASLAVLLSCLGFAALSGSTFGDELVKGAVERTDFYGDQLPRHAVARLGSVRFGPLSGAWGAMAMDMSPDGMLIATDAFYRGRNQVDLWDTSTGKKIGALLAGTTAIISLRFSPDGNQLAVAHAHRIDLLSVKARVVSKAIDTGRFERSFWALCWSGDGKYLAAVARDETAQVWDAATGEALHVFFLPDNTGFAGESECVAFSPDGKRLAVGGNEFLRVFDVATGTVAYTRAFPKEAVKSVSFSPDGKLLGIGVGVIQKIALVQETRTDLKDDAKTKSNKDKEVKRPEDAEAIEPASKNRVELWRADGTRVRELPGTTEPTIWHVRFTPDGKTLLATGTSGPVVAWDVSSAKVRYVIKASEHSGYLGRSIAMSAGGRKLATAQERIGLWDAATGAPLYKMDSHGRQILQVQLLADGKTVVTAGADSTLRYWELATGRPLKTHRIGALFSTYAVSPDGKLIAVGGEGPKVRLLDGESLKELAVLETRKPLLAPRPRRRLFSWLSDRSVPADPFENLKAPVVTSLTFLPGGQLVSSSLDGAIDLWDVRERRHLHEITNIDWMLTRVVASPDGKTVAVPFGAAIDLWDVAERKRWRTVAASVTAFSAPAAFSPDGKRIVTGFPNKDRKPLDSVGKSTVLRLWDCASGKAVWTTDKAYGDIAELAYSPDGKLIASVHMSDDDHHIRLWSAASGKELLQLEGHLDRPRDLLFSPDGMLLLSGGQDATVLVWDVTPALERLPK